jgi:hypothetical protein
VTEEGWYSDPFRVHEHRWFSDGTPTALVRDQGATSQDPPPEMPYLEPPRLIETPSSVAKDDLRRSNEEGPESVDPVGAAWTYFTRSGNGF